jgi:hypothetical protein
VRKYAGAGGVNRLRELRQEIRGKEGGNIVKGPKADELKRRLQEEGLLPTGKPKSMDAGQLFQKQVQAKAPSVPPELKEQLKQLGAKVKDPSAKPDSKYGKYGDNQLQNQLSAARALGKDDAAKRIEAELKRRGVKLETKKTEDDPKKAREKEEAYKKLVERQQKLVQEGKINEAVNLKSKVDKALKEWEDANAVKLKAQQDRIKAEADARPKGLDEWGMKDMRRIDKAVESDLTGRAGKAGYDWENSLSKGAKVLGAGSYGTAILGSNGDVVKRGEIGQDETRLIQRAGELGVGPKVISAELDGPADYTPGASKGRIAMTLVDGEPIGHKTGKEISNAYWKARATLHRGGIAHNDMHIENVLVGKDGKGRFVDMGMAQENPKAALAEAFGTFSKPLPGTVKSRRRDGSTGDGDWQARRYGNIGGKLLEKSEKTNSPAAIKQLEQDHPNAARVYANRSAAINRMKRMGLTDQEITDIMFHGIRSKDSSFEKGAMGKLTNDQAKQIIEVLYDGI